MSKKIAIFRKKQNVKELRFIKKKGLIISGRAKVLETKRKKSMPATPKENPIILGIDPGTQVTGYGIISITATHSKALDFGCIRPPKGSSSSEKYLIIFNAIEHLMDKYLPSAVSVETQFVYKNAQSAMKLGMARGMVILAAAKRKIPLFEYAPKKAKLAVVGNGSASKEQVQKMVQILLKLPSLPHPQDASDALALAMCHAHSIAFSSKLTLKR